MTLSSQNKIASSVNSTWERSALPSLKEFIKIPNQSPAFDKQWQKNRLLEQAAEHLKEWILQQSIKEIKVDIVKEDGRTPVVFVEIPGDSEDTVFVYGHLDKQPPGTGWSEGLGPYQPVEKDGKLYGRGAADDGYAPFSAIAAIKAIQETGHGHARCIVMIEASEESNSRDLPHYLDLLRGRIGSPDLVVCLDSVCGDYDRLWITTSLRGSLVGTLRISLLKEGIHSGSGGGIVPTGFRIARQLLARLEDPGSGSIIPSELYVSVPGYRLQEARALAELLGDDIYKGFPWRDGAEPVTFDLEQLIINQTWRPSLTVTGLEGIPPIEQAGNSIHPFLSLKLSLRLPPLVNPDFAAPLVKELLEQNPPYGADVSFTITGKGPGWNAPRQADWLSESINSASENYFGNPSAYMGVGGGIPLLNLLENHFPGAQFVVTGMLGPESNPHGPNESLDLEGVEKLTSCISQIIIDHHTIVLN